MMIDYRELNSGEKEVVNEKLKRMSRYYDPEVIMEIEDGYRCVGCFWLINDCMCDVYNRKLIYEQ